MARDEEFRTPVGQAAWIYYQEWMKAYHRQVPKSKAFLHSKFYTSFVRFAKFVKKVQLPDPKTFIWLMKEKDISPTIWNNDQVYALYLEFLDKKGDPTTQAEITIDTLFKIADAVDCDVQNVFEEITPGELIELLRQRRLSPWILLHSKKFMSYYAHKVSSEERIIIESIVRPQYWAEKFKKYPDQAKLMKTYVQELNL